MPIFILHTVCAHSSDKYESFMRTENGALQHLHAEEHTNTNDANHINDCDHSHNLLYDFVYFCSETCQSHLDAGETMLTWEIANSRRVEHLKRGYFPLAISSQVLTVAMMPMQMDQTPRRFCFFPKSRDHSWDVRALQFLFFAMKTIQRCKFVPAVVCRRSKPFCYELKLDRHLSRCSL